jgi:hypothetical protein
MRALLDAGANPRQAFSSPYGKKKTCAALIRVITLRLGDAEMLALLLDFSTALHP